MKRIKEQGGGAESRGAAYRAVSRRRESRGVGF